MDAVRISDGKLVELKRSSTVEYPHEVEIAQLFSSAELAADPRNHCVPIYEAIPVPDLNDVTIIVLPLLYEFDYPEFETVGEVVESFRQIFEGVQFIHEHNIAHGDCKTNSFMVDSQPLYGGINRLPHPAASYLRRDRVGLPPRPVTTRTRSPVKYYIIDFNLSRRYEDSGPHLESPAWGGDKTVPEWRTDELCGWEDLRPGKKGFQFMKNLANDMCQDDPGARPNMSEVFVRFEKIRLGLSERKLRSRIARKNENVIAGAFRFVFHWGGQAVPICRGTPAIPAC
ncbi:hypothetical protein DFH09DRAFT_1494776 [Mycena vulgaris]|nr:hypothetical protein DFH09DRAFT_1494776 [Mycena vulgaris]